MSRPVVSISVPEQDRELFKESLPTILGAAGDDRPMKLSKLVQEVVLHGQVVTKEELQNFTSKEALTTRDKYLILILA